MPLPFNRVQVRFDAQSSPALLSVAEFGAMPLTERVRAVLEKRVQFFQDEQPIETGEALKALRERAG
jgi:hypothetical protein